MGIFIKKIFMFSLFIICFVYFLQLLLTLRIHNKSTTGHDNLEQTLHINADLVFLGSSRCWVHFDPVFFNRQFGIKSANIGIDGHSELSMIYARLIDYLKGNVNPKYIVLSLDPFIHAGNFYGLDCNYVHKDNFARYAFVPFNKKWETVARFNFSVWEKYVPLFAIFKYKQLVNSIFQNNISTYMKYGYEKHDLEWDIKAYPIATESNIEFKNSDQRLEMKLALSVINEFCIANGIKLICIQTPVYNSIYDEEEFLWTKLVCDELKIPYLDSNIEEIRDDISCFYNSNHMNTKGVSKMNEYLVTQKQFLDFLGVHE